MSFLVVAAHPGAEHLDLEPMLRVGGRGWDAIDSHRQPGFSCAIAARWTVPEDEGQSAVVVDPDSGRILVWDGRLDDRAALSTALELDSTASTPALLLRGFRKWGDDLPRRLLGDFAFLIFDPFANVIFAARDRLGIRPLVYTRVAGGLRFASEERALLAMRDVSAAADEASAARFIVYAFAARKNTLYERIKPVPHGSWLEVGGARERSGVYYRPDPWKIDERSSDKDFAAQLREAVDLAVACRTRGSRLVGVMASGGLDSSAIAVLLGEHSQRAQRPPPLLLHLRCAGFGCDELRLVEQVATKIGSRVVVAEGAERVFSPDDGQEIDLPDTWTGPYGELYEAAAAAGCRVVLTGEGSDEVQGWHGSEVEDAFGRRSLTDAARFSGLFDEPADLGRWRRFTTAGLRSWVLPRSFLERRARGRRDIPAWLTPKGRALADAGLDELAEHDREVGHPSRLRRAICSSLLWSTSLTWSYSNVRRFASRHGVDLALPFLDARVVDLLLTMPARLRTSFDMIKPLQRRAFEGKIPVGLLWNQQSADYTEFHRRAWVAAFDGWVNLPKTSRLADLGLVDKGALAAEAARVMGEWSATPPGGRLNLRAPVINALQLEAWLSHLH